MGSTPSSISLGASYSEECRRYLLDQVRFPDHVSLKVVLSTAANANLVAYVPVGGRSADNQFFTHSFVVPGILFALSVGQNVPSNIRELCLVNNVKAPIFVADTIHEAVKQNIGRTAQRSKPVGKVLRDW